MFYNSIFTFIAGASMGLGSLNFGNITLDPNNLNLPFDKKLLEKIKHLIPGEPKTLYNRIHTLFC